MPKPRFGRAVPGQRAQTMDDIVLSTQPAALVEYWPLLETGGAVARARKSVDRNGAIVGSPALYQRNAPFLSPSFNGTSQYINLQTNSLRDAFPASRGTVAVWMRVPGAVWTADANIRRQVLLQADGNNRVILNDDSADGRYIFYYVAGGVTSQVQFTQTLWPSGWNLLALTWDKPGDAMKAYVNDVQVGTTQTGLGTWAGQLAISLLGAGSTTPTQLHTGELAHLALWSTPLTGGEIAALASYLTREAQLVLEGDSLTVGGQNGAIGYPTQMMRGLAGNVLAHNVATGGQTVAAMLDQINSEVLPKYDTSRNRRNIAVLIGGANDLSSTDPALVHDRIVEWHRRVRARGFETVAATLPAGDPATISSYNTKRATLNARIASAWPYYADHLLDLARNPHIGPNGAETNGTYFNADKLHLTTAGYGQIDLDLRRVLGLS